MSDSALFTTAEIGIALGLQRQAVRWHLRDTKPSGTRLVKGNETAGWSLADLPLELRRRLDAEALRRGCRGNPEAVLAVPLLNWPPEDFPALDKIAEREINLASKLRQALMPSLLCQRADMPAAEFEARGAADFLSVFGNGISVRHWRRLLKRTLARDAGDENFSRLELYLPDAPALKNQPGKAVPESAAEFAELADYVCALANPAAPSDIEMRGIWTLAFERYDRLVAQGIKAKRAARRIREFLFAIAPFLAPSRDALLKAFARRLEKWTAAQADPKALRDGRDGNGSHFDFPQDDLDRLIHCAVFQYRGDIAPAWRDCLRTGFSDAVRQRYLGKAFDKSYVPAKVIDLVGPEVEIFTVMHRGPRAFDSIRGHVMRSYDGIASLQCLQADDFTLNSYFWVPNGKGWFKLTRGQVILFIDFRTLRILGWALEPRESYSSLTIRTLCTHVFAEFGVPEVLYFERGLWQTAKLLKGQAAPFGFMEISQGLREFGIRFIHAIRPRSKTVERVGGLFQDIAEAEPGYCGRDERRDAPESLRRQMAEVDTRKVHPEKYFYSYEQWNQRIGQLAEEYNSTAQQGRILAGLSPDDAFQKFLDHNNPPMQFGAQLRYLLAHDKRRVNVTLNGITIRIGKQPFNYRGQEIAHLVGREVLAWFDPENLEALTVTDLDRQNPICVARSTEPSALQCLTAPESDTLAIELRRVEAQASRMKTRYNVIKAKFGLPERRALADAQTLELGERIQEQKSRMRGIQEHREAQSRNASKLARQTGIVVRDPGQLDGKDEDVRLVTEFLNRRKS